MRIRDAVYNVRKGIGNLIHYAPAVWIMRDWDFSYSVNLLGVSLNCLADGIEKGNRHEGCEDTVKEIRETAYLCKRIWESDPTDEEYAEAKLVNKLPDSVWVEHLCEKLKRMEWWWD